MRMAIRPAPIDSMIDAARAFNGIVVSREKAQEAALRSFVTPALLPSFYWLG